MFYDPLALPGPVESDRDRNAMNNDSKRPAAAAKPAKKPAKKDTLRDVPDVPTAKQIEQSINKGTSVPLTEFVKGVKL
jgi:hypothetical protein